MMLRRDRGWNCEQCLNLLRNLWSVEIHDKRIPRKITVKQMLCIICLFVLAVYFLYRMGFMPCNDENYQQLFLKHQQLVKDHQQLLLDGASHNSQNSQNAADQTDSRSVQTASIPPTESNTVNNERVIIFGEDQFCGKGISYEYMDIGGQEHSGTNAMWRYLYNNCREITTHQLSALGKHRPRPSKNNFNHEEAFEYGDPESYRRALHVVTIRDPLTWLMGICKREYEIRLDRSSGSWVTNVEKCPRGISGKNGAASANVHNGQPYPSLIALWNDFYGSWVFGGNTIGGDVELNRQKLRELMVERYGADVHELEENIYKVIDMILDKFLHDEEAMRIQTDNLRQESDMDIAVLVVRHEDILFRPRELVQRVCSCAGGTTLSGNEFIMIDGPAKTFEDQSDRNQIMKRNADPEFRYSQFSREDFEFIDKEINHEILKIFGFDLDRDIFDRMEQRRKSK